MVGTQELLILGGAFIILLVGIVIFIWLVYETFWGKYK